MFLDANGPCQMLNDKQIPVIPLSVCNSNAIYAFKDKNPTFQIVFFKTTSIDI